MRLRRRTTPTNATPPEMRQSQTRTRRGRSGRWPPYETLVLKAREMGLAGATVLRGPMGFGPKTRRLHTTKILQLSTDLPMIIEIVDSEEQIRTFLETIESMMPS